MYKKEKIWINNKFVDIKSAKISVFDRGFLYGDGVFETMRSYAGVIFKLDEHLDRLFKAFKVMRMKSPYSKRFLKEAIYKSLKINGLQNAYIRLAVTRGEGRFGIGYKDEFNPNVVIVAKEFEGYPEWMHKKGISAKVVLVKQNEFSPLAKIKSMNYLNYIIARFYAKDEGFDEAILTNTKGYITEGATSNIFLVKGNSLVTPSVTCGILPGITRGVILKIAKKLGMNVREKLVSRRELLSVDEIFLTNSLAEVLPIVKINSTRIVDGLPGKITKLLHVSYQKQVIKESLS